MTPLVNRMYSTDTPKFSDDLSPEEETMEGLNGVFTERPLLPTVSRPHFPSLLSVSCVACRGLHHLLFTPPSSLGSAQFREIEWCLCGRLSTGQRPPGAGLQAVSQSHSSKGPQTLGSACTDLCPG